MNRFFSIYLLAGFTVLAAACVETEIIPEILEPQLDVSPKSASLLLGSTTTLTGTFTDAGGENRPEAIQWRSDNTPVAEVNAGGLVTGKSAGQAWIIASAPGGLSDSALVTVVENNTTVARIDITGAPATLNTGASITLQARAFNMSNQELTGLTFDWSSSNSGVLTIDATGNATGISPGTATITASAAGLNSLPVSIQVIPVDGMSRSGMFSGNSGYTVKGTATLRQMGSDLVLELGSDFMSGNGPQLGVFLAKNASGGLTSQNSLKLGNLTSNTGAQSYPVPGGTALGDYDYVVIYCIPFNVRFGTAALD